MELWGLDATHQNWECLNEPAEKALECDYDEMTQTRKEADQAWLSEWAETE
jgi:hypothetical protein